MSRSAADKVREAGGEALLERLLFLDQLTAGAKSPGATQPIASDGSLDFDVVLLGGGLSLVYAPLLADAGFRVAVVERSRAGVAHREWNASRAELQVLVDNKLVTAAELDQELIVAQYDYGIFRWHGAGEQRVNNVLDCALDAGPLLAKVRERAEAKGVVFFDHCSVHGETANQYGVALALRGESCPARLTARVVVDGRGSASPYAAADLICPTVGGVLQGLEVGDGPKQIQPNVGEILVTTEGIQAGRQHLWEAFPGRPGDTTVYLFYYAEAHTRRPGALLDLYARFFDTLGSYKAGEARLLRPTFGFIPGWTRLSPGPNSGHPRIVLVGDAGARHSPLTFCGFGATLRALPQIVPVVEAAMQGVVRSFDEASVHRGTGALAMLLARPPSGARQANDWNELFDAAFSTLESMGPEPFQRLLRDEMGEAEFIRFLTRTSVKRPRVYLDVARQLGLGRTMRWGAGLFGPAAFRSSLG
jgi:lycopene cyclase CruA